MEQGAQGQKRPQAARPRRRRGRARLTLIVALALVLCGSLAGWTAPAGGSADRHDAQAQVRGVAVIAQAESGDEWDDGDEWGDDEDWGDGEDWEDGESDDEDEADDEPVVRVSMRAPKAVTLRRGRRAAVRVRVTNRNDYVHRATLTLRLPRHVQAAVGRRPRSGTVRLPLATLRGRRSTAITVKLVAPRRAARRTVSVPLVVHASGVQAARSTLRVRIR